MTDESMPRVLDNLWLTSEGSIAEEEDSARAESSFVERSFAAVMIAALLWFLLPLALASGILQGWPVFFRQWRTGRGGQDFRIWKFRTMAVGSARCGVDVALENDSRITWFGKFLRSSKLDELTQLWNVLQGEMSFFGPRPMPTGIVEFCRDKIPHYDDRHRIRPGITGLVQALFHRAESLAEDKVEAYAKALAIDLLYIEWRREEPSIDIWVALATVAPPFKKVLRRKFEARAKLREPLFFISTRVDTLSRYVRRSLRIPY